MSEDPRILAIRYGMALIAYCIPVFLAFIFYIASKIPIGSLDIFSTAFIVLALMMALLSVIARCFANTAIKEVVYYTTSISTITGLPLLSGEISKIFSFTSIETATLCGYIFLALAIIGIIAIMIITMISIKEAEGIYLRSLSGLIFYPMILFIILIITYCVMYRLCFGFQAYGY